MFFIELIFIYFEDIYKMTGLYLYILPLGKIMQLTPLEDVDLGFFYLAVNQQQ